MVNRSKVNRVRMIFNSQIILFAKVLFLGLFSKLWHTNCHYFRNMTNFALIIQINKKTLATYTITVNERSSWGKALMNYLHALGVIVQRVPSKSKSSYIRSQEDKKAGRVESFDSSEEMFESLGI